jgi:hypothetical protein
MVLGREILMDGVRWRRESYAELGVVWASMAVRLKAKANGKIFLIMEVCGEPQLGREFRSRVARRKDRAVRFGGPRTLRGA